MSWVDRDYQIRKNHPVTLSHGTAGNLSKTRMDFQGSTSQNLISSRGFEFLAKPAHFIVSLAAIKNERYIFLYVDIR